MSVTLLLPLFGSIWQNIDMNPFQAVWHDSEDVLTLRSDVPSAQSQTYKGANRDITNTLLNRCLIVLGWSLKINQQQINEDVKLIHAYMCQTPSCKHSSEFQRTCQKNFQPVFNLPDKWLHVTCICIYKWNKQNYLCLCKQFWQLLFLAWKKSARLQHAYIKLCKILNN